MSSKNVVNWHIPNYPRYNPHGSIHLNDDHDNDVSSTHHAKMCLQSQKESSDELPREALLVG